MKRIALIAAAAALAAPAVFAQTAVVTLDDVIDHSAVVISPPIGTIGLPEAVVIGPGSLLDSAVAIEQSSTAVLGGPPAVVSSSVIASPATAILDVPAHAVTRPDFQRWLASERSRVIGVR
jgi:hypothetical protein